MDAFPLFSYLAHLLPLNFWLKQAHLSHWIEQELFEKQRQLY